MGLGFTLTLQDSVRYNHTAPVINGNCNFNVVLLSSVAPISTCTITFNNSNGERLAFFSIRVNRGTGRCSNYQFGSYNDNLRGIISFRIQRYDDKCFAVSEIFLFFRRERCAIRFHMVDPYRRDYTVLLLPNRYDNLCLFHGAFCSIRNERIRGFFCECAYQSNRNLLQYMDVDSYILNQRYNKNGRII